MVILRNIGGVSEVHISCSILSHNKLNRGKIVLSTESQEVWKCKTENLKDSRQKILRIALTSVSNEF